MEKIQDSTISKNMNNHFCKSTAFNTFYCLFQDLNKMDPTLLKTKISILEKKKSSSSSALVGAVAGHVELAAAGLHTWADGGKACARSPGGWGATAGQQARESTPGGTCEAPRRVGSVDGPY